MRWKKGVAAVGHLDHGQAAGERDLAGHVPGDREGGHKGNHSRGIRHEICQQFYTPRFSGYKFYTAKVRNFQHFSRKLTA